MNIREIKPRWKKEKQKNANSALQHVRVDFRSMIGEEHFNSFITDVHIIQKPAH